MNESNQPALLEQPAKERRSKPLFNPKEFKIQALRECPTPAEMQLCDTPDKAADYWRQHVVSHPYFNRDVECFVILLVNSLELKEKALAKTEPFYGRPPRYRPPDQLMAFLQSL